MRKKNLIIYDGSNFYHSAKKLSPKTHLSNFNYLKFAQFLSKSQDNRIIYCVGEIKRKKNDPKSSKLYASQQSLFYHLEKQGIGIIKGFMLFSNSAFHEKGVDVRIALEIQRGAIKNEYDKCFIISSDTDILPAIADAKTEKKKIIYVGFDKNISRALKANCNQTISITKKIINQFGK